MSRKFVHDSSQGVTTEQEAREARGEVPASLGMSSTCADPATSLRSLSKIVRVCEARLTGSSGRRRERDGVEGDSRACWRWSQHGIVPREGAAFANTIRRYLCARAREVVSEVNNRDASYCLLQTKIHNVRRDFAPASPISCCHATFPSLVAFCRSRHVGVVSLPLLRSERVVGQSRGLGSDPSLSFSLSSSVSAPCSSSTVPLSVTAPALVSNCRTSRCSSSADCPPSEPRARTRTRAPFPLAPPVLDVRRRAVTPCCPPQLIPPRHGYVHRQGEGADCARLAPGLRPCLPSSPRTGGHANLLCLSVRIVASC